MPVKGLLRNDLHEPDKNYKPDKEYPRLKRRIREKSGHKGWVYIYNFRGRTRFYTIGQVKLTEARKIALSDSEIKLFWPELTAPLKLILLTG